MVHLDSPDCFNAEVHRSELCPEAHGTDDAILNIGDAIVRSLFSEVEDLITNRCKKGSHMDPVVEQVRSRTVLSMLVGLVGGCRRRQ